MRNLLIFLLLLSNIAHGQQLPSFLAGTWKRINTETYEHWDQLNDRTLKGFAYKKDGDRMIVLEYLEITRQGSSILYTASVPDQNEGKPIDFRLVNSDGRWVFENRKHDFPKQIIYEQPSEGEITVTLSDGAQKKRTIRMAHHGSKRVANDSSISNPNYDSALAAKLGADDYGMKGYILVLLKTGSNQSTDRAFIGERFRGHLENINRLVDEGKLVVAGPLGKNDRTYRGIFILNNVSSLEEAKALLQTDPAVEAGLLNYELYNWYGSAALPLYLDEADKIWKVKP